MENIYYEGWEQELIYQFLPYDRCKKRAYICSPLSADTNEGIAQNMQATRAYMFYAMKKMGMNASAPHAYLPMILCDNIPSDRALALQFGLELLKGSDILLICGNRISSGMRGEIAHAIRLKMPMIAFDEGVCRHRCRGAEAENEVCTGAARSGKDGSDAGTFHYHWWTWNRKDFDTTCHFRYLSKKQSQK